MSMMTNLAKTATISALAVLLSAGAAMAIPAEATSSVNVRSGPSTGYAVLDTLRPGEGVDIRDRDGSWCLVQKSGPDGWVSCSYLAAFGDDDDDDVIIVERDRRPDVSVSFGVGRFGRWDDDDWDRRRGPWWRDRDRDRDGFSFSISN